MDMQVGMTVTDTILEALCKVARQKLAVYLKTET